MEKHLLLHCKPSILQILKDESVEKHFPLNINFIELFENDTNLGNDLLKDPEKALKELNTWILHVQDLILRESEEKTKLLFKQNIHGRVYGLPTCPELHRTVFPRDEDLDIFLQITGTVVKTKDVRMLEHQRPYRCSKCKHVQMVEANYDQKYIIVQPKKCLNPDSCQGRNFVTVGTLSSENCKDYQEIKIQEQSSNLNSTMPSSLWVTLEDDLVDLCKPGDDVTICGIVKRRWGPLVAFKKIDVELALKANHIKVHNGNTVATSITSEVQEGFSEFWKKHEKSPLEGRDVILKSFCPQLYGMYLVKLAMAIVLASGNNNDSPGSGIQKRGECHILLVGDPGTGKSQLLRYSSKIIARSVLTTGVGTTSAGLTVAAVMEDGQWQLEAGALVLADGGICCIDEFNSMKSHDRASIHEAMEQQTISVAKAGIHTKLRTRCSILAATNPKGGHLDPSQSLSLNLAIPSPLLSRFDVVLMLKDTYTYQRDSVLAKHVLSGKSLNENKSDGSLWSLEMLQQYFIVVKSYNPPLSPKADQILGAYYQAQRQGSARNKSRTTVRLLESLIRLSQGHAKLMCHQEVWVMDAVFAIIIIESSMHGECSVLALDSLNVLDSFSNNPIKSYVELSNIILTKLGLNNVLKFEMDFLTNIYGIDRITHDNKELLDNSEAFDIGEPVYSSTQVEVATKIVLPFNENQKDQNNFQELRNFESNSNFSNLCSNNDTNLNATTRILESKDDNHDDSFNRSNSFNIDFAKNMFNEIKKADEKSQNICDSSKNSKKRKNCAATNNGVNMLNLIQSVNDDFDFSNLNTEKQDFIFETQNTKSKNFQKKFKFQPKDKKILKLLKESDTINENIENINENVDNANVNNCKNQMKTSVEEKHKFQLNSISYKSNQTPTDSVNVVASKDVTKSPKKIESNYYNFDDLEDYHIEKTIDYVPKTDNAKSLNLLKIESEKIDVIKTPDTNKTPAKNSIKAKFAFIPKNPSPDTDISNLVENKIEKENELSIFESDDLDLDFLDLDI